ncbi:MAG: DUF2283 domain-containing protein [Chloroflexi bacterium]|nr:DUF2283 domain-containing protein [Chloroflexota bacterium]
MEQVRALDLEEIRKANHDLAERMTTEKVMLAYNPEADVLSITVGTLRPALTEPVGGDVMYRVDPDTLKVLGFEIMAFFGHYMKEGGRAKKVMGKYLEQLQRDDHQVSVRQVAVKKVLCELFGLKA